MWNRQAGQGNLRVGLSSSWVSAGQTGLIGVGGAVWLGRFVHDWIHVEPTPMLSIGVI
jgi:hypothetical protein